MKYSVYQPPLKLKNYVRFFWILESDGPGYIHRSMADVCPELLFHYKGRFEELKSNGTVEKSFISGVHGQSQKIRRFGISSSFGIFGVYLYPYAIPILFGVSARDLSDQMPDLFELCGKEGSDLEEKMMLALDNCQRMEIITDFLERRISKAARPQHAVFSAIAFMIKTRGAMRIGQVAERFFLSERQFERQFKEFSGFRPKLFARISRFHAACQEFGASNMTLTELALNCGYYDQSHFIHDFKEFSGHHPREFFSGKAEGVQWRID